MSSMPVGAGASSVTGITTRGFEEVVGAAVGGGAGAYVEVTVCEVDNSDEIVVKEGRVLLNEGYVIVGDSVVGLVVDVTSGVLVDRGVVAEDLVVN